MLERYTERARRILFFAHFEALQSGSAPIDGSDLLLALMRSREAGRPICEIFDGTKVELDQLRDEIERQSDRDPASSDAPLDEHAFSEEARQMLQFAEDEAARLGDAAVDSEHLLVGILSAEGSRAASLLKAHGFRLDEIRHEIDVLRSRPPLSPGVHISATKKPSSDGRETGSNGAWALEGFGLKAALSRICGSKLLPFPSTRIELPASLDPDARYDFLLVIEPTGHEDGRHELMRRGVETHFRVKVEREDRPMDVYVLTAPESWRSTANEALGSDGGGFVSSSFMEFSLADLGGEPPTLESITARFPTPESLHRAMRTASIGRISVSNGTLEEFCRALEQTLDRPVVDETRRGEARPRAGRRITRPRRAPPQRAGTRADARPSVGALDRRPRERLIRRTLELRSGAVRRFPA